MRSALMLALLILSFTGCSRHKEPMDPDGLREFGTSYTNAWCSQAPRNVAAHFADGGSLTINDGERRTGRRAITAVAQEFMTAFPDMIVRMDSLATHGDTVFYHWTLTGTNTGPGGTGNPVHISGHEKWLMSDDGLIAESEGYFDEGEYKRQLNTDTLSSFLQRLEESLLQADVRKSSGLAELLADDFIEYGRTGATYTRDQLITLLHQENPVVQRMEDFSYRRLGPEAALLSYRVKRDGSPPTHTLRSSVWRRNSGKWQMVFHQATPTKTAP